MKLIVKSLKGTQFEVESEPSMTVGDLKNKIFEEQKIEASTQKLVAVGKVMADDKTLEEYKLKDGDFIVVMISKPKIKKKVEPAPVSVPAPTPPPTGSTMPPAPTPPPVGGGQTGENPPSAVLTGGGEEGNDDGKKIEETVAEMQSMGFEKDQWMAALRAAFYNPERAVDYLLNGIPQDAQPEPEAQPNLGDGAGAGAGDGTGVEGMNDLSFLRNNPMFTAVRERIIREPEFFQTFMNQLAQTQPQIHQAISANPQAFLNLMLGDGAGAGGAGGAEGGDPPGTIRVSQDEKDAIDRICQLGFQKHRVIEAYFAWDKNEEWTANFLFENAAKDDNYDQQVVQEESLADAQNVPAANAPGDVPMPAEQQDPPAALNNSMEVDNPNPDDIPVDNAPEDNAPAENPPAENPPADNAPADNASADNAPADNAPADNAPADNPPAEDPPADNPPAGNNDGNPPANNE